MATEAFPCRIEQALGVSTTCPRERCPFWETGGCAFGEVDFSGNRDLAAWLLHIRELIDVEKQATRTLFSRLLNEGQGE